MTTDIREGLALALVNSDRAQRNWPAALWEDFDEPTQRDYLANADAAISYLRQHDGHAEFVRVCRTIAEQLAITNEPESWEHDLSVRLAALCDAELAKEQSK